MRKPGFWISVQVKHKPTLIEEGLYYPNNKNNDTDQLCSNQLCSSCADPEGGTGGPDPPWNLKNLP